VRGVRETRGELPALSPLRENVVLTRMPHGGGASVPATAVTNYVGWWCLRRKGTVPYFFGLYVAVVACIVHLIMDTYIRYAKY
jgi:hypothetical protein